MITYFYVVFSIYRYSRYRVVTCSILFQGKIHRILVTMTYKYDDDVFNGSVVVIVILVDRFTYLSHLL